MKYLEEPKLSWLSSFLGGCELGDRALDCRIEAFSCKRAGTDKKLAKELEKELTDRAESEKQNEHSPPSQFSGALHTPSQSRGPSPVLGPADGAGFPVCHPTAAASDNHNHRPGGGTRMASSLPTSPSPTPLTADDAVLHPPRAIAGAGASGVARLGRPIRAVSFSGDAPRSAFGAGSEAGIVFPSPGRPMRPITAAAMPPLALPRASPDAIAAAAGATQPQPPPPPPPPHAGVSPPELCRAQTAPVMLGGAGAGAGYDGGLADARVRRLLIDLISTMNATFPDYDFRNLQLDSFTRERSLPAVVSAVNQRLAELVEHQHGGFLKELWGTIEEVIQLSQCEIFVFLPDLSAGEATPFGGAGALWSFNYFFWNPTLKKVLYFHCQARSTTLSPELHAGGEMETEMEMEMELAAAAERGQPYSQPYSPCPQQQALTEQDMKEEEERQQQVDEEDQDMLDMEMAEMLARET